MDKILTVDLVNYSKTQDNGRLFSYMPLDIVCKKNVPSLSIVNNKK